MRLHTLRPVLIVALAAGCESVLDVDPVNEIAEENAITTPLSARAAVAGMYDALQSTTYYGGTFTFFGDLSAEDVEHTGTFTTYRQADLNNITTDNTTIEALWDALYRTIGRGNIIIARVPGVPGLDAAERDQMLGEAYFVRALTYHNLVKLFGEQAAGGMGVPLVLIPPRDIPTANDVARAPTGDVYTQILNDLQQAQTLMNVTGATRQASVGAVRALRARVYLYQQQWALAEAEAEAVALLGYSLAPQYGDLFTAEGDDTDEDILRLGFTAVDFNLIGYYYRASGQGGRREVTPSPNLLLAYDPAYTGTPASYNPVDLRGQWNVAFTPGGVRYGSKYPTGIGAEHLHVIRFAEVLLIQAEAEAQQNKLGEADAAIDLVRTRAGLPDVDLTALTQADAITAILQERRLELAYEGDRWPDLVRTGLAAALLASYTPARPAFQQLYPIPLNELDVAENLVQNPGY